MTEEKFAFLLRTKSAKEAYGFIDKYNKEKHLIIISRDPASEIQKILHRKSYNIWVTNIDTDIPHLKPYELEQMCYDIEKFITDMKDSIVLLCGTEYLISYNSFNQVYHMIHELKDLALVNKSILVVNIGNKTLMEKEENMLFQELSEIGDQNE